MSGSARSVVALRTIGGLLALTCLAHGVLQALGALSFWMNCFSLGMDSEPCLYAQYKAPTPWWVALQVVAWPIETVLATLALILSLRLKLGYGMAFVGFVSIVLSNFLADYVLTPVFNGGHVSADNPPGYGVYGAALVLMAVVAYVRLLRVLSSAHSPPSPQDDVIVN